jgi:hypothetical protein
MGWPDTRVCAVRGDVVETTLPAPIWRLADHDVAQYFAPGQSDAAPNPGGVAAFFTVPPSVTAWCIEK